VRSVLLAVAVDAVLAVNTAVAAVAAVDVANATNFKPSTPQRDNLEVVPFFVVGSSPRSVVRRLDHA
jgi:hypothetical protein